MKKFVLLTVFFFFLSLAGAAAGQTEARPDFSGVWKLNLQASHLEIPAPDSGVFRVEHKDPVFHLSRTFIKGGQEDTWTIDLITNGTEVVQEEKTETFRGRLSWKESDLVLDSTITVGSRTAVNTVTYHLSNEGRTLTTTESFRGPRLKYDNIWVFDKE